MTSLEPAHDIPVSSIELALTITNFWSLVDRSAGPDECHPWTGYVEKGYGGFFFDSRMIGAHELAVLFTTGEVRPVDWETCHYVCNNPICCNPRHLRYGTHQDNVDDMTVSGTPGSRFSQWSLQAHGTGGAGNPTPGRQWGGGPFARSGVRRE